MDKRVCEEAIAVGYEAVCNSEPGLARMGTVIKRVAVMHSTSQKLFEALVQRKPGPYSRCVLKGIWRRLRRLFLEWNVTRRGRRRS